MSVKDLIQQLQDINNPEAEAKIIATVEVAINDEFRNFPIEFTNISVSSQHPKFVYLTAC